MSRKVIVKLIREGSGILKTVTQFGEIMTNLKLHTGVHGRRVFMITQ